MKANELMIGDWVEIQDIPKYYKVYGIEVMPKGDACRLRYEDYLVDTWCDRVNPIPLTEEILKVNGWKRENTYDCTYYWHSRVPFDIPTRGFESQSKSVIFANDYFESILIRMNYVHELQRALRCYGLFDLANNFKV